MRFDLKAIKPPPGTLDRRKYERAVRAAQGRAEVAALQELQGSVRGWKHKVAFRIQRDGDVSSVTTDDEVFIYQDRGTGTHAGKGRYVITPKRKRALHWPGAAHPVKRVSHPGVPARKFSERAAEKLRREYQRLMNEEIGRVVP